MKPVDFRNETFASLKAKYLVDLRLEVLEALKVHGPCTTKELAVKMRPNNPLFLVDMRPRVTELYQLGFVVLVGKADGRSELADGRVESPALTPNSHLPTPAASAGGVYRACSDFEARGLFAAAKANALREQKLLNL
ncbi:MAG: hypothetical protein NT105_23760 [Verrucomicrobia bacterium]|nr:hypothetical protein [Verrucomicrobiota bacterium]